MVCYSNFKLFCLQNPVWKNPTTHINTEVDERCFSFEHPGDVQVPSSFSRLVLSMWWLSHSFQKKNMWFKWKSSPSRNWRNISTNNYNLQFCNCDLFGMGRWPFQTSSGIQQQVKKGHDIESPSRFVWEDLLLNFYIHSPVLKSLGCKYSVIFQKSTTTIVLGKLRKTS